MNGPHRQRGIGFWMLLLLAIVLGGAFLLGLKLFPIYTESLKIDTSLQGVIEDSGTPAASKREIRESLLKRLDIEGVQRIRHKTFEDYVTIEKEGNNVTIIVEYEAETPLVANLSLVADFYKVVSTGGAG